MQREQVKKSPSFSSLFGVGPPSFIVLKYNLNQHWTKVLGFRWPPPRSYILTQNVKGVANEPLASEGVGEQSSSAYILIQNVKGVSMATPGQRRGGHRTPPSMQRERVKNDLYLIMSQVLKELVKIEPIQLLQLRSLQA